MTVRAKFRVQKIERTSYMHNTGKRTEAGAQIHERTELHTIVLIPVFGNGDPNHENTKFWQASPSGEIKLGTINAAAAEQFVLGEEYYIDFTPAPKD